MEDLPPIVRIELNIKGKFYVFGDYSSHNGGNYKATVYWSVRRFLERQLGYPKPCRIIMREDKIFYNGEEIGRWLLTDH